MIKYLQQKFCKHNFQEMNVSAGNVTDFKTKTVLYTTSTCSKVCKKCGLVVSNIAIDAPKAQFIRRKNYKIYGKYWSSSKK